MLSAITVTQASYLFVLYLYGQLFAKYNTGHLFICMLSLWSVTQASYSPCHCQPFTIQQARYLPVFNPYGR